MGKVVGAGKTTFESLYTKLEAQQELDVKWNFRQMKEKKAIKR